MHDLGGVDGGPLTRCSGSSLPTLRRFLSPPPSRQPRSWRTSRTRSCRQQGTKGSSPRTRQGDVVEVHSLRAGVVLPLTPAPTRAAAAQQVAPDRRARMPGGIASREKDTATKRSPPRHLWDEVCSLQSQTRLFAPKYTRQPTTTLSRLDHRFLVAYRRLVPLLPP